MLEADEQMLEDGGLSSASGGDLEEMNATSGTSSLLGIGAASGRAGVTERALRYYQQLGLLTPAQ